jgi:hypothetical protein
MENAATPKDAYYQFSGRFGPVGLVIMLGFSLVGSLLLGAVYGVLVFLNPIGYLDIIGAVGVGWCVATVVRWGVVIGKVRNTKLHYVAGVLAGCTVLWVAWVSWLYIYSAQFDTGALLVLNPAELWDYIVYIGQNGAWGFPGITQTISGAPMFVIWGLEAVLVIGSTFVMTCIKVEATTFCERCGHWVNDKITLPKLAPLKDKQAHKRFKTGDISDILALRFAAPGGSHTQIELKGCPTCDEIRVADVVVKDIISDGKSKDRKKMVFLAMGICLSPEDYQTLLEFEGVPETPEPNAGELL